MAIKSLNFDYDAGNPTANLYTAADWRDAQMAIVSNGIILPANVDIATDTSLKVTAITGGVNIANGKIAAQGAYGIVTNTVAENVLIAVDGTYKIVMEFNSVLGKIYSKAITSATALTQTATVWQLQLATVVKSGTTYTVTDTRQDSSVCGYANQLAASPQAALQAQLNTGWIPSIVALTYASADSPTFVVNTASDLTGVIGLGNRIKLTQTTVKYFIVTAITSTAITLYGGTDYTLANATISNVNVSNAKSPLGFPLNPDKWSKIITDATDRVQASPTSGTYYNVGSAILPVPIGVWTLYPKTTVLITATAGIAATLYLALSTGTSTASDTDLISVYGPTGTGSYIVPLSMQKIISVSAKTNYYLNAKVGAAGVTSITYINSLSPTTIKAVCAYL